MALITENELAELISNIHDENITGKATRTELTTVLLLGEILLELRKSK